MTNATTPDLRAAAQQAADVLDELDRSLYTTDGQQERLDSALTALRAALAAAPAAIPALPPYIVREAQRAIEAAEKPAGMSTHDGKAVIPASYLRRLLAEATQPPAGWGEFLAWWESLPSDAFGGSIEALAKAAFKAGAAAPAAPAAEPRQPLTDERITQEAEKESSYAYYVDGFRDGARFAEKHHGIGGATGGEKA